MGEPRVEHLEVLEPDSCVPAHVQTCRALMILSLLVGLASIMVSVLGLKCTKIGRTSENVKEQMVLSGGILFVLSGTCSVQTHVRGSFSMFV